MAWQTTTETGRVIRLATAAESQAAPTLPLTGSSIDWTDTGSGGAANGWTASSGAFTEDDFEFTMNESDPLVVNPPLAINKLAEIIDKAGIEEIAATSYEVGEKVYDLMSNITESPTGTFVETVSFTRRAVFIEWAGLGGIWCPSCELRAENPGGGVRTLATQAFVIRVFGIAGTEVGSQWKHYQDS